MKLTSIASFLEYPILEYKSIFQMVLLAKGKTEILFQVTCCPANEKDYTPEVVGEVFILTGKPRAPPRQIAKCVLVNVAEAPWSFPPSPSVMPLSIDLDHCSGGQNRSPPAEPNTR